MRLEFRRREASHQLFLDGRDLGDALRSPEIGGLASLVSGWPAVRRALLSAQRALGREGELVAEGRDMGTVVFPEARLKFFLTAALESRAERRRQELSPKNPDLGLAEVMAEIEARDLADETRSAAPLIPSPEAVFLDSTSLGAAEVLNLTREIAMAVFALNDERRVLVNGDQPGD
jgi:cytidylate kinase